MHNKHERKINSMKTYIAKGLLGAVAISALVNVDPALGRGGEELMRLNRRPPQIVSIAQAAATIPNSPAAVLTVPTTPAIDSAAIESAAKLAFPNLSSEMTIDELLNKAGSDGSMRGNLRGRFAERDWIERNNGDGWKATRSKNAPENDAWRRTNGKLEGAQVKVHADWKDYIRSMRSDTKAEHFVIPDDHHKLVAADLAERLAGAERGGQMDKAAEYRKMQSRLKPLGRTFGELDQAIEDAALAARQATKVAADTSKAASIAEDAGKLSKVGKVLGVVGVVGAVSQGHQGVEEIRQGDVVKGAVNLTGATANLTSAAAGLAGLARLSGGAAAVGAGIDGATDLHDGINTGNGEKTAVGGVKVAAAGTMAYGTATLNPVALAGGALAYGGAVAYDNRDALASATKKGFISSEDWAIENTSSNAQEMVLDHTPDFIKRVYFSLSDWIRR